MQPYYPPLHYNQSQADFYGGNSGMAGRADTAARIPLLTRHRAAVGYQEMANPDSACGCGNSAERLQVVFRDGWVLDSLEIAWPSNVADHMPAHRQALASLGGNTTPGSLQHVDRTLSNKDFANSRRRLPVTRVLTSVSPFTSKFDYYLGAVQTSPRRNRTGRLSRGQGQLQHLLIWMEGSSTLLGGKRYWPGSQPSALCLPTTTYNNLGLPKKCQASLVFRGTSRPMGVLPPTRSLRVSPTWGMGLFSTLLWRPS